MLLNFALKVGCLLMFLGAFNKAEAALVTGHRELLLKRFDPHSGIDMRNSGGHRQLCYRA